MKLTKIVALSFLAVIALASCKKDYTCNCTSSGFTLVVETYSSVKKADAESKCSEYEADAKEEFPQVSCSIAKK